MDVNVLETHVCICERMKVNKPINTFNMYRQEGYLLQFYIVLHNISFSPKKGIRFMHLSVDVKVTHFS